MLVRKQAGNAHDYFDKTFADYQRGFSANGELRKKEKLRNILAGEIWIGLEKLHQLTSVRSFLLKITMTDYDGKEYVAVYEQFKVDIESLHLYLDGD